MRYLLAKLRSKLHLLANWRHVVWTVKWEPVVHGGRLITCTTCERVFFDDRDWSKPAVYEPPAPASAPNSTPP